MLNLHDFKSGFLFSQSDVRGNVKIVKFEALNRWATADFSGFFKPNFPSFFSSWVSFKKPWALYFSL